MDNGIIIKGENGQGRDNGLVINIGENGAGYG